MIDGVLRAEQFGILQQNPAGLGVHFDVAHQVGVGVFGPQILDLAFDLLALGADLGELFGLRLDRRGAAPAPARRAAPVAERCWAIAIPAPKITAARPVSLFISECVISGKHIKPCRPATRSRRSPHLANRRKAVQSKEQPDGVQRLRVSHQGANGRYRRVSGARGAPQSCFVPAGISYDWQPTRRGGCRAGQLPARVQATRPVRRARQLRHLALSHRRQLLARPGSLPQTAERTDRPRRIRKWTIPSSPCPRTTPRRTASP